jgi:hypothetical protein
MNTPALIEELNTFLALTELREPPIDMSAIDFSDSLDTAGRDDAIVPAAQVAEKIFDGVIPGWRTTVPDDWNHTINRWCQHREAAQRAKAELERREEVHAMLGDNAPDLNAAQLHPWIWDGARSLWQSGHYREAVGAAAVKLNAELQNKISRRDISEYDLFRQAFSIKDPEPGRPRLRLMANDGSKTWESIHAGAGAFSEGLYRGIRNPSSHIPQSELLEHEALEQLAAFSVLARWVDTATVETI